MGVLYAKVAGAWEPVTGAATTPNEVFVGATDPRPADTNVELWFDTAVPPGTLKAWNGTAWVVTGGSTVIASDGVPIQVPFGVAGAAVVGVAGTSADYSRADHSHGQPAHTGAEHAHVTPNDLADPTADVSWAGFGINNLLDPVLAQDAATKAYADTAGGAAADDLTIAVVPTTSLTAAKSGSSATGDLLWTITLNSLTLANTITTPNQPDPNTPLITGEPGDTYVDTVLGTYWVSDGTAWTQITAPPGAGVTAVGAGVGVAVDATTPSVPVVSVVVDPASDPALTVSATGISLATTTVSDADLVAKFTAAAGAGLVEATAGSGVLDVAPGAGIAVVGDLVTVSFGGGGTATTAARSDNPGLTEVYISAGVDPDTAEPGNAYELWYDSTP